MSTMQLQHSQWQLVQAGTKTVEIRLNDPKRQVLQVGDPICLLDLKTGQSVRTTLIAKRTYASFTDLLTHYTAVEVGSAPHTSVAQMVADMLTIYSAEQVRQWGVVALTIKRLVG
ncbi:ASCH domain-containing protein [Lactiplantibacillus pentosus]|uniref:ASCH domain-containing protein n=1 Tax=Lactiplantibacillus pentosus TaxID=1589 RepID=UPI00132FFBD7|nr:ASCH domain-containing protein [Lactiplantibacillus pentosus]MBQ0835749.1 RNA-binding protein [Lactiplantibacillus pentosus]MBU7465222.1 RNA-binding protein [Lactiplantibacillus pentosus]MBU7491190.1 RNA-binding protein [Lactiplantibacillus pentosus]MBU7493751.1 RNA-binding protein [Lactiplantibacillus pentosus]MBU7519806.1 RNA-binding protein [Lactiplantibacillus pentosus]